MRYRYSTHTPQGKLSQVERAPLEAQATYNERLSQAERASADSCSELGGLLRTGIPEFRLPADVLTREIDRILDLGVEVITGVFVNRERLLQVARSHNLPGRDRHVQ